MGTWIIMLISYLIIPLTMIGFGRYFIKTAPKEINDFFGYRTTMSMKNKDTWEFAHHYCGKLWVMIGWFLLILTIIAMLFVIGYNKYFLGNFGLILCSIQVFFLIGPIIPTEIALKKNFDKNGNRKK